VVRRVPTILTGILVLALAVTLAGRRADTLPATLGDSEFWSLSAQLSEPNGFFVSRSGSPDNLLSNEMQVSTVAAALVKEVSPSGVYLGVGPEQNFTYIAAIKPRIAFITDIRRGNLDVQLLYKALFETSASRAEFVARLFSRTPVAALSRTATAAQLMTAYAGAPPVAEATFGANLKAVIDLLTAKHGFAITTDVPRVLPVRSRDRLHLVNQRPPRTVRHLRGPDGERGHGIRQGALLSGERGELRARQGDADQESDRARRRRLRGPESAACDRRLAEGARRDRQRLLRVERRTIPRAERRMAGVLCQRGDAAAHAVEHLHPTEPRRLVVQPDGRRGGSLRSKQVMWTRIEASVPSLPRSR
jgi:hypothetical protein